MSPLVLSVMHEGKSNWEPRQVGDWLGYLTNTIPMIFQVPVLKIEKPKAAAIHAVLNCQSVPVRDKLLFNDLVMVYKCLKNLTPGYLHGCFQYRAKIHQRVTRQNNDLTLPQYRLATGQKTFTYCRAKLYNSIAKDIRDMGNLNTFKERIFKYLFNS